MKPGTSQKSDEDQAKTLYVRLPYTIKSAQYVQDLFLGNVTVKLPRQSSRYCHVIFSTVEEKMKNLKNIKKLVINGHHVIACPPKVEPPEKRKKKEKKIRVPKPKPEPKITKTLYISNIKLGSKPQEVKLAFPGCTSIVMLKSKNGKTRKALLKLGSIQLAGEYLRKERKWPEVRGNRLHIKTDNRKRKITGNKNKSSGLKIYGAETEVRSEKQSKKNDHHESTQSETEESDNSEDPEDSEEDQDEESKPEVEEE